MNGKSNSHNTNSLNTWKGVVGGRNWFSLPKILHLGPGLGYVTRHKSFCIGMFTMFSCSSQYTSNIYYVLPLFWQEESLNVFVLYILWEAWRESDQRNFGLFARAHGEKKKASYFLSSFLLIMIWGHGQAEALSGFPGLFSVQMLYVLFTTFVHR